MATITPLPGPSSIRGPNGDLGIGLPKVNADDMGAANWRDVSRLGQAVQGAGLAGMKYFIEKDHQRQRDDAERDLLTYDTERNKQMDSLLMTKGQNAFQAGDKYIDDDPQYVKSDLGERGGLAAQIYNRGKARIDAQNVTQLNRHSMVELQKYHEDTQKWISVAAVERIRRNPGAMTEELTVIEAATAELGRSQGWSGAELDTRISTAKVGAITTAMEALVAQHGPEAALGFLSSDDAKEISKWLGPQEFARIFDRSNSRLTAQAEQQALHAQENAISDAAVNLYKENGSIAETYEVLRTQFPNADVSYVRQAINFAKTNFGEESSAQETAYLEALMAGGSFGDLELDAWEKGPNARIALAMAAKKAKQYNDDLAAYRGTPDELKVDAILADQQHPLTQQIQAGNWSTAAAITRALKGTGQLTATQATDISSRLDKFKNADLALTDMELSDSPAIVAAKKKLQRQEENAKIQANRNNMQLLDAVMEANGDVNQVQAWADSTPEAKDFVYKTMNTYRDNADKFNAENYGREFYRYDSMGYDELVAIMVNPEKHAAMAQAVGGFKSDRYKQLYNRYTNPGVGQTKATTVTGRVAAAVAAYKTNVMSMAQRDLDLTQTRMVIADAINVEYAAIQDKYGREPTSDEARTIEARVKYEQINKLANFRDVNLETTALDVSYDSLEVGNPEIASRSIKAQVGVASKGYVTTPFGSRMVDSVDIMQYEDNVPQWSWDAKTADWIQKNIPYGAHVKGNEVLTKINNTIQKGPYRNMELGELAFSTKANRFVLYDLGGHIIGKFEVDGTEVLGGPTTGL